MDGEFCKLNFDRDTPPLKVLIELANVLSSSIPSIQGMGELAKEKNDNSEVDSMLNHILETCNRINGVTSQVYPYIDEVLDK